VRAGWPALRRSGTSAPLRFNDFKKSLALFALRLSGDHAVQLMDGTTHNNVIKATN